MGRAFFLNVRKRLPGSGLISAYALSGEWILQ